MPVGVQANTCDPVWGLTLRVENFRYLEGAVPVSEKYINRIVATIADGKIHFSVFVEIAARDRGRDEAGRECRMFQKSGIAKTSR